MTAVRPTAAAALTATLGLAAAYWAVSVGQMTGMGMGTATRVVRVLRRRDQYHNQ